MRTESRSVRTSSSTCPPVRGSAIASVGSGFSHNVHELLLWRSLLGVAEASGVSAVGKAVGLYLFPEERAVGSAMGQLGLSLGAGLAPGVAVYFAYQYSWRWTFFAVGILSLAWIPVWLDPEIVLHWNIPLNSVS